MMKGRKSMIGSPRMSRARVLPISTAGSRQSQGHRLERLKTENASFLEVTPLAANSAAQRRSIKYENTYKLEAEKNFVSLEIEKAAEKILVDYLHDKEYEPAQCKTYSQQLSSRILETIKDMGYGHFKMVCIVSIGSMKERPGMQFGSRCLWNKETDNFISAKFSNTSLFAVAMVYGLYYD
ncbi:dynein light chain Tctex-type 5-like isoform X2 [Mercenaria mercenaria]|nr:dynein light chain Tctex-type 5-like isoform X2 [Mercenaria mercenaria]XP_053387509.1 dynein light chain Tctex-type 5-like isoform X2 [Mercenaria mercenaria]